MEYVNSKKIIIDGKIKLDSNLINKTNLMKLKFKINETVELTEIDNLVYSLVS